MTRSHKALGVFLVTMFGLWGCARGPAAQTGASADKVKALEAKVAKLEDDLKSATAAKDVLKKKVADAQDAQAQLQQEFDKLQVVVKERDDLKAQLKTRTAERDVLQAKYEGFLKDLKDLAGRAETALHGKPPAAESVVAGPQLPNSGGN
jgi:chromosome segregation ATPase